MDDNVVLVRFADQSKAYQALSTLKDIGADGRLGGSLGGPARTRPGRDDPGARGRR